MSVFDLIILAILIALTLRGIWKGMVSQIVSVASFFVCWFVATRFGSIIAPSIPVEAPWNQVIAMAIIFLITMIAVRFAHAVLEKLIQHWHLAKINTMFGGILGLLQGLLLCMVITFFAVMFSETSRGVVFNSKIGLYLVQVITQVSIFVPKDSYEFVHTQLEQFKKQVDDTVPGQDLPELKFQNSETVQQLLNQVQQLQTNTQSKAGSLWGIVAEWWGSSKKESAETLPIVPQTIQQTVQNTVQRAVEEIHPQPAAATAPPPMPTTYPAPMPVLSEMVSVKTAEIDDLFQRRTEPVVVPLPTNQMQNMTALLPSAPESLPPLAPLQELTALPENNAPLVPLPMINHRIGSDLLLRNSSQTTRPESPAALFRSR